MIDNYEINYKHVKKCINNILKNNDDNIKHLHKFYTR